MSKLDSLWRLDNYRHGYSRVVSLSSGTPVIVSCGKDKETAMRIVEDHNKMIRIKTYGETTVKES